MIIFGLGNPTLKYTATRHNAGYIFLERMAKSYKKKFLLRRGYKTTIIKIDNMSIRLIKPLVWMNNSGVAIKHILNKMDDEFLVIMDDVNLPLGRMRLREGGSDGGHLGLRSIIEHLNTQNFPRLRIGIGQPQGDGADYVLSKFSRRERKILISIINEGITGIEILVKEGFNRAQNFINSIVLPA